MGSSRLRAPSSASCKIKVTVNDLVTLPIRKLSVEVGGRPVSMSASPNSKRKGWRPGCHKPAATAGRSSPSNVSVTACRKAASVVVRAEPGETGVGSNDELPQPKVRKRARRITNCFFIPDGATGSRVFLRKLAAMLHHWSPGPLPITMDAIHKSAESTVSTKTLGITPLDS